MKKQVLYGTSNYDEMVQDHGYFVDKTHYIEKLDKVKNPVFLRPRRFGKSLWCQILEDDFYLKLPNLNMQQIFVQYFNEIHHLELSTDYTTVMQRFVNEPNLEQLFAGYWEHYVSQLPEAIFPQVNENFYRTTFFEVCSRYLSRWFVWHVERSYPQGKSEIEAKVFWAQKTLASIGVCRQTSRKICWTTLGD